MRDLRSRSLARAVFCSALAALSAGGCSSDPAGPQTPGSSAGAPLAPPVGLPADAQPLPSSQWAQAAPDVVWARPGATLVLALDPSPAAIGEGFVAFELEGSGSPPVRAPLVWIGTRRLQPAERAAATEPVWAWLGRPPAWLSLRAPRRGDAGAPGGWFALLDLPAGSFGRTLIVDGKRISPTWAKDAPFQPSGAGAPERAAGDEDGAWTDAALGISRRSPLTRWRARLSQGEPLLSRGTTFDRFDDPALEALASQIESQWTNGLERLEAADPDLARLVKARLALMVRFPQGPKAPMWSVADESHRQLLFDLSDAGLSARSRALRARVWLSAQPAGAAWVLDDAGATDAGTGSIVGAIGVMNLTGSPTAASAAVGERGTADIVSLKPAAAGVLSIHSRPGGRTVVSAPGTDREEIVALEGSESGPARAVESRIRIGEWEGPRRLAPGPIVARPPGLALGPLMPDWSIQTLIEAGSSPSAEPLAPIASREWSCAGLLQRDDAALAAPGTDLPAAARTSWVVYLECRVEEGSGSLGLEQVRLYFGATGSTRVVLTIYPDGRMGGGPGEQRIRVARLADRWTCWVPVPASAVESLFDRHVLRLGVVRDDARAERSAWPRPMLPWQAEPGRVLIDLSGWSRLGER